MDYNPLFISLIIIICSLFQSIFGVGLLLFGTPTLLLLGIPFIDVLSIVLPPSLSISILQVIRNKDLIENDKGSLVIIFLSLLAGLCLAIFIIDNSQIELMIGVILILISLSRINQNIFHIVKNKLVKFKRIVLSLISFVHGMTNLGGGFLTFYMSARFTSKEIISANIALIYALFASFQLSILFILNRLEFTKVSIVLMLLSGFIYLLIGKFLITKISEDYFRKTITFIIFFYGLISVIGSLN